jgi:hypothetical protein
MHMAPAADHVIPRPGKHAFRHIRVIVNGTAVSLHLSPVSHGYRIHMGQRIDRKRVVVNSTAENLHASPLYNQQRVQNEPHLGRTDSY